MTIIKKVLCKILGHKLPADHDGWPIAEFVTTSLGDKIYGFKIMPCTRCFSYTSSSIYTREQWEKIDQQMQERLLKQIAMVPVDKFFNDFLDTTDFVVGGLTNKDKLH